jgi:hypothetical protein
MTKEAQTTEVILMLTAHARFPRVISGGFFYL